MHVAFNLSENTSLCFLSAGLHLVFEKTETKILSERNNSKERVGADVSYCYGLQASSQLVLLDVSYILHTKVKSYALCFGK